ncbi:Indolepyruvate oxidoreductase subunit [Desulfonema limicola]|uniref:Indolepyruvate oxidoreductase subunit IorA n=1 Tax=Desulfonema limicola TaxID=45656 RepID=A0A975GE48_9BACT|nr:thiamine pyrophosphate-dependent enzyme [Desulfonema limicola]QTA77891.1 Indolepyruvate oxidoreductase subunit [Desulfonema limicola]
MNNRKLMLGNEAIALGLVENKCAIVTSYPGTPASEILSSAASLQKAGNIQMHTQWAVNEKIAFEIAYTGSISSLRTAVSMKQVGLNVASDPLMSAAYMGTKGGFIIISADDPGPHSSQTEQDSRMMAMMAKIPVLDPDSPAQAREMVSMAYELSEEFGVPVMLRPSTRVCHSRQDIETSRIEPANCDENIKPDFQKDPARWAATPKFRYQLHKALEEKLAVIAKYEKTRPVRKNPGPVNSTAIVVSGVCAAHAEEILKDLELWDTLPLYQVIMPFPLHTDFISHLIDTYEEILVIEETTGIIEIQLRDRHRVKGKMNNIVPCVGELSPEKIEGLIRQTAGMTSSIAETKSVPGRRPTLCAGCPHRASFFAIKKAAPKGIYTSDIGCYTLGLNLGAVDTVLCMGAAVSQAAGFFHAYKNEAKKPDIVATIGDSTFFHSGIPALVDAVVQNIGFVLVILDNRTTAMTGSQPTPDTGLGASGEPLKRVNIESLVKGCGIEFCKTGNPYNLPDFTALVKEAVQYSRKNGPAVVISRYPCLLDRRQKHADPIPVRINENCDGCGYCIKHFECPALVMEQENQPVYIDPILCSRCGVCIHVCPKGSIEKKI